MMHRCVRTQLHLRVRLDGIEAYPVCGESSRRRSGENAIPAAGAAINASNDDSIVSILRTLLGEVSGLDGVLLPA